jgi:hypothetical protein
MIDARNVIRDVVTDDPKIYVTVRGDPDVKTWSEVKYGFEVDKGILTIIERKPWKVVAAFKDWVSVYADEKWIPNPQQLKEGL